MKFVYHRIVRVDYIPTKALTLYRISFITLLMVFVVKAITISVFNISPILSI